MSERRSVAFRLGAAVLGLAASAALAEIGLRVFHHVRGTYAKDTAEWLRADSARMTASEDPELAYVNRPDLVMYGERTVEAHGLLRPTDVDPAKPPGTLRLAVVGDSVGAATYLEYKDRFTTLLEPRLSRELRTRVEVLNFCTEGYGGSQEARLLETKVPAFHPDAVLVVYCMNDPADSYLPLRAFQGAPAPTSYAWDFLRRAVGKDRSILLVPLAGTTGPVADHWRRMYDRDGDGWARVERSFDRFAAWSRASGVPLGVVAAPLLQDDDPDGRSTAGFRAQVAAAVAARGLAFLDLQAAATAAGTSAVRLEPTDIYHFGPAGHVVLADATAPFALRLLAR